MRTVLKMIPFTTRSVLVLAALLASAGFTLAATGSGGYSAAAQVDVGDADTVSQYPVRDFHSAPQSLMAVDSSGTMYLAAVTLESSSLPASHEILRFTPGANGATDLAQLLTVGPWDSAYLRELMVVPETTTDNAGNPVLIKDHLLLAVDGWDAQSGVSSREIWQVDPSSPALIEVLYQKTPEPMRAGGGIAGYLWASVDADGVIYLQQEFEAATGGITALDYSEAQGEYVERSSPVTTALSTVGPITVGPDGHLYGFEASDSSGRYTDRIIRIDPLGTDTWTSYADLAKKLGTPSAGVIDLAFDSDDQLWMLTRVTEKRNTKGIVAAVQQGTDFSGGDRAAESDAISFHPRLRAGSDGTLYVIDGYDGADTVYELAPGSGGGSGGGDSGGGGGKGGGKGKNK